MYIPKYVFAGGCKGDLKVLCKNNSSKSKGMQKINLKNI